MQNKGKILLLTVLIAVNFIFAGFADAQSVAPNELDEINRIIDPVRKLPKNDAQFQAAYNQQRALCINLGERIRQITSNKYITAYQEMTHECVYAVFVEGATRVPDNLGRMIRDPNRSAGAADAVREVIRNSTAPVTQQSYQQTIAPKVDEKLKAEDNEAGPISKLVGLLLKPLFGLITGALLGIAALAGAVLSWVINTTTSAAQPASINVAWTMIRDVMNLVFIIALIVISIATILRIESYSYKKLLPRLILMALLINFSKVIADTLIGFSDMITGVIANGANFKSYGQLFDAVVAQGKGSAGEYFTSSEGILKEASYGLMGIVFAVMVTVSFLVVAGLLLVRMVGLWVLVVISPAAYALNILPSTKKYAGQWWSKFIQYLIWAPISVFFLRIGLALLDETKGADPVKLLITTGFMWAAFFVAKSSGMAGAAAVTGAADNFLSKAKKFGKDTGKFAAGAAGSMAARGTYLRGAGALANKMGFTGAGDKLKKSGDWVNTKTAQIKTMPGAIKGKWIDAPNAKRKKEVDKQAARWQLGLNGARGLTNSFDGEVTKDNVGTLKPALIWEMMKNHDERITAAFVEGIKEHGNRGQLNALAHGVKQGFFDQAAEGDPNNERGRDTAMAVRKAHYMSTGGKEKDWHAYVEPNITNPLNKDDITVKSTPGKKDEKDHEKKVVIKYRTDSEERRGGGPRGPVILTDAGSTPREGTGAERLAARRAAAGMGATTTTTTTTTTAAPTPPPPPARP